MKVLTHKGFKKFDGVLAKGSPSTLLCLEFNDGSELKCTHTHRVRVNGEFIEADLLDAGFVVDGGKTINAIYEIEGEEVYDLVNVEDTHAYFTNGVISHNCIYLDEFAFVPRADEFWASTYPTISSGNTTQVIITSTINGPCNLFYNLWEGALQGTNDFVPLRVDWWDVPGRDEEWAKMTRRNIGEVRWRQEYCNEVIGASNSLISPDCLMRIKKVDPIETTNRGVKIYEYPKADSDYVMCVDVARGRGQDYSTFTVLRVEKKEFIQVAAFRDNLISPLMFPDLIAKVATYYNMALLVVENNDAGQVVCHILNYELEYENLFVESMVKNNALGVNMTKKVKRIGCSNFKDLIELDRLKVVDKETILEMSNFVEKGNSYEADGDGHDDMVMNLVLFSYFTSLSFFSDLMDNSLHDLFEEERSRAIEDSIPFAGIMDQGTSHENDAYNDIIKDQMEWSNF